MTLRDELARAILSGFISHADGYLPETRYADPDNLDFTEVPVRPDQFQMDGDCDLNLIADACLALLRSRIPGFDALVEGSAVVVPSDEAGGRGAQVGLPAQKRG